MRDQNFGDFYSHFSTLGIIKTLEIAFQSLNMTYQHTKNSEYHLDR